MVDAVARFAPVAEFENLPAVGADNDLFQVWRIDYEGPVPEVFLERWHQLDLNRVLVELRLPPFDFGVPADIDR